MNSEVIAIGILKHSTLNTKVGGRIYVDCAPQQTPNPCIVISESMAGDTYTKSGYTGDIVAWQIDIYANTAKERNDLALELDRILNGFDNEKSIRRTYFYKGFDADADKDGAFRYTADYEYR